jgi:hypothetical protein
VTEPKHFHVAFPYFYTFVTRIFTTIWEFHYLTEGFVTKLAVVKNLSISGISLILWITASGNQQTSQRSPWKGEQFDKTNYAQHLQAIMTQVFRKCSQWQFEWQDTVKNMGLTHNTPLTEVSPRCPPLGYKRFHRILQNQSAFKFQKFIQTKIFSPAGHTQVSFNTNTVTVISLPWHRLNYVFSH